MVQENADLQERNIKLAETRELLMSENAKVISSVLAKDRQFEILENKSATLSDEVSRLEMRKLNTVVPKDLEAFQNELSKYLPDAKQLVAWGRYCSHICFPDSFTQRILRFEAVPFKGQLYSPEHSQKFGTEHSVEKLERDSADPLGFMLKIDGMSIFQWFKKKAQEFLDRLGFKKREPNQSQGLKFN